MRKGLLVVSIIVIVVAVLGLAGYGVAQARGAITNRNVVVNSQNMPGMFNDFRGNGRGNFPMMGMMNPIEQYLLDNAAKALNMTSADLQTQLRNGSSLWQIAQSKGMTSDQFAKAMQTALTDALSQAVKDGRITQSQADQLSTQLQGWENRFGFGFGYPMMGPGGRMNRRQP